MRERGVRGQDKNICCEGYTGELRKNARSLTLTLDFPKVKQPPDNIGVCYSMCSWVEMVKQEYLNTMT